MTFLLVLEPLSWTQLCSWSHWVCFPTPALFSSHWPFLESLRLDHTRVCSKHLMVPLHIHGVFASLPAKPPFCSSLPPINSLINAGISTLCLTSKCLLMPNSYPAQLALWEVYCSWKHRWWKKKLQAWFLRLPFLSHVTLGQVPNVLVSFSLRLIWGMENIMMSSWLL